MQHDRFTLQPGLFGKVCRTCLCEGDMTNIFEVEHAVDVLSDFLSIKVSNDDTFPQNICNSCREELGKIHNFAKRCRVVEDTLKLVSNEFTDEFGVVETIDSEPSVENLVEEKTTTPTEKEPKEYNCRFCTAVFTNENELRIHNGEAKHPKILNKTCHICNKTYRSAYMLRMHIPTHTKEKLYNCDICSSRFSSPSSLKRHKKLHTGDRPFVCEACGKAFIQSFVFKEHMKVQCGKKPYLCSYCDKTFLVHKAYMIHLTNHKVNNGESPKKEQIKQLESHTCEVCSSSLSSAASLKTHMLTHGEKMFLCTDCGKCFYSKAGLTSHSYLHSVQKHFKCQYCEKSFKQRGSLAQHLTIHTPNKKHACKFCSKSFGLHNHLQSHLRIHTGERPYSCHLCSKTFSHTANLTVHIRTHTGEKPYHCPVCDKGFYDSSSRSKHLKGHGDIDVLSSEQKIVSDS